MSVDTTDDEGNKGDRVYLGNVADGCGCTEIWEYLSERRAADGGD